MCEFLFDNSSYWRYSINFKNMTHLFQILPRHMQFVSYWSYIYWCDFGFECNEEFWVQILLALIGLLLALGNWVYSYSLSTPAWYIYKNKSHWLSTLFYNLLLSTSCRSQLAGGDCLWCMHVWSAGSQHLTVQPAAEQSRWDTKYAVCTTCTLKNQA